MEDSPHNPSVPPDIAARYPPIALLGRGSQGCVYLARQPRLNREVVVKVLTRLSEEQRTRFAREARTLSKIVHPAVPVILDFEAGPGTPFFVTQYDDGETLRDALGRRGPLPWREAAALARDVASGLASVHALGIVHRDVSPANILVTPAGARILDFGAALDGQDSLSPRLTDPGTQLGTPLYMAPEVLTAGDATPASDLFSLGLVLFEALSGRLPYEATTMAELIEKQVNERVHALPPPATPVPPAVSGLVLQMLEKQAPRRPRSLVEVAARLDAALTSATAPADPAGLTSHLPAARPAVPAGTVRDSAPTAAVLVALALSAIVGLTALRPAPHPRASTAALALAPLAHGEPKRAVAEAARWLCPGGSPLELDALWRALVQTPVATRQRELELRLPAHPVVRVLAGLAGHLPWPPEPVTALDRLCIEAGQAELSLLLARCRAHGLSVPAGVEALLASAAVRRIASVPAPPGLRLVAGSETLTRAGPTGAEIWLRRLTVPRSSRDVRLVLELHRYSDACPAARLEVRDARGSPAALRQAGVLAIDPRDRTNRAVFEVRLHPTVFASGDLSVELSIVPEGDELPLTRLILADAYLIVRP